MEMVNFNVKCFIDAASELLRADETIRALHLLDNLPAYYREFPPKEVSELKQEIMAKVATGSFYATNRGHELEVCNDSYKTSDTTLRGKLLLEIVKHLNDNGATPHITDMGPGECWLPRMLEHHNTKFTYNPIYVNYPSYEKYKPYFEKHLSETPTDRPNIFFACEIIEHLWNEHEIRYEMQRQCGLADIVEISTPCYTYNYTQPDWKLIGDLGHLQAFTPKEFFGLLETMFPEYNHTHFVSQILHGHMVAKNSKFDVIKNLKVDFR